MAFKDIFNKVCEAMAEAARAETNVQQRFGEIGILLPGAAILPQQATPVEDKARAAAALNNKGPK